MTAQPLDVPGIPGNAVEGPPGRCLLVLDGLDEVPYDLRGCIREAVTAVLATYHAQKVIVTCRIRSYVGETIIPDFQPYTLAAFDDGQVRDFVHAWYSTQHRLSRVDAQQARDRADDLARMERAVLQSRKTLCILTPEYLQSEWAEFENLLVQTRDPAARQRRLIPLLLSPCALPPRLGILTYCPHHAKNWGWKTQRFNGHCPVPGGVP